MPSTGAASDGYHRIEVTNGCLRLGGVALRELAETYGTPLYVIDAATIQDQAEQFRDFGGPPFRRLLYSIKANPNIQVIRRVLDLGFGLDACSPGDVELAVRAGASGNKISYTGVGLQPNEMRDLVHHGVWVNLDSSEEVEAWVDVCPGCPVGLRVVPEVAAGFHPHCTSGTWGGKFGIPSESIPSAVDLLRSHRCRITTLHAHLGSSISDESPYIEALDRMIHLAVGMPDIQTLNLGGGIAARFHPDDSAFPLDQLRRSIVGRVRRYRQLTGRGISVELEPGEFLVSEAGYLLTRVLVTKHHVRAQREVSLAVVDGGMNLFPAHSLYGSYLHVYVDGKEVPLSSRSPTDIYGNTNQSGDRLAQARMLPLLERGDILIVRNAGAYAYCRSTQFNERPRPGEVWVEHGQHRLIREPEGLDVLYRGQVYGR